MEEIKVEKTGGTLTFYLKGEIVSANADEFFGAVMNEYEKDKQDVVFDCADLTFIDSTTLGTFVKIFKRLRTDGKNMKLIRLQSKIKKLFTICSLDKIMELE